MVLHLRQLICISISFMVYFEKSSKMLFISLCLCLTDNYRSKIHSCFAQCFGLYHLLIEKNQHL